MIELKNAVNEAKIKLGLSNSELSKLIGHSRNYISETLRIGASTEKQAEITGKIKEAVAVELDRHKREVDFLITSIANRYEVTFNHKVELKESRSIKKSEYFDNIYYVTENALNKLKKQYSYECDL
mgnify:CR=1 FL=1